ncbi:MAG: hypothetical protein U0800_05450 [Isosphaeraceae bacterium]
MNRRAALLLGLAVLLLVGAALPGWLHDRRRLVAEATSPDQGWGVAVVGRERLFGLGGIEVAVEVRDDQGRALPYPGTYVVGTCSDWSEARGNFGSISCGNTQAVVNGSTLLRKSYFGP